MGEVERNSVMRRSNYTKSESQKERIERREERQFLKKDCLIKKTRTHKIQKPHESSAE